ncbi:DUF4276 family protein [Methanocalculus sp.]|uniref:DUF4276 family protein n=1 Tax=Methanocalculus sp. TaxID=2004547 RepID=UPI00271E047F|nr:DUF4276 family protein [Methanocalculus sp.]MDO8841394.1 DUF4276 family protein [Methanocalculus sp.]
MRSLVFFLEEASAEEMLKGLLPRILPADISPRFIVFEGKQDLEKQIIRKMKGWNTPDTLFVVMRDQDGGDCIAIKESLVQKCIDARHGDALVRIACHELESFYLGDPDAVKKGLGIRKLHGLRGKSGYENPDLVDQPSRVLMKLTKYQYQKIGGSRAIGPYLAVDGSNSSHSFNVLIRGILELIG